MTITFENKYYRLKKANGKKAYSPIVLSNGFPRILKMGVKHPFSKAQSACDYGAKVASRYNQIFGSAT